MDIIGRALRGHCSSYFTPLLYNIVGIEITFITSILLLLPLNSTVQKIPEALA